MSERRVEIGPENRDAEKLLGDQDGSGVGINYADAYIKGIKSTLSDGRKVAVTRRGLKLTLRIGERAGEGLLRRLANGPDERTMLRKAIEEAAENAGAQFAIENEIMVLFVPPAS